MTPSRTPLRLASAVCDGCGRCVKACRQRALKVGIGYIFVDWPRCDGCGACAVACDREAILLRTPAASETPAAAKKPAATKGSGGGTAAADRPAWMGILRSRSGAQAAAAPPKASAATAAAVAPAWSLPEAVLVAVVAFALLVGAQALAGAVSGEQIGPGLMLVAYDVALAGLLVFLALRRGARPLQAYRLSVMPEWTVAAASLAFAVGTLAFALVYQVVVRVAGFSPPAGATDLGGLFGGGLVGGAATVLLVGLVGPVVEEAALRGVVLSALKQRFGPWPAIVVSALVFALLHASLWSFVPLTVLGLSLGWLAQRSRSLLPAVFVHVAYNLWLVVAALYVAARG